MLPSARGPRQTIPRALATLTALAWLVVAVAPPAAAQSVGEAPALDWPPPVPGTLPPADVPDPTAWAAPPIDSQWLAQSVYTQWAAQATFAQWAAQATAAQWATQASIVQLLTRQFATARANAVLGAAPPPASAPPAPAASPTPAPQFTTQQLLATVAITGAQGVPCAVTVGNACTVTGTVQGSGTVTGSMTWSLTARVPNGIPPGTMPVAALTTTRGTLATVRAAVVAPKQGGGTLETVPCTPVAQGVPQVTCSGQTVGSALQGSQLVVAFTPTIRVTGLVAGPIDPLPNGDAATFTQGAYQVITVAEPVPAARVFGGPVDQGYARPTGRFFTLRGEITTRSQAIVDLNLFPPVLNTAEFIIDAVIPPGLSVFVGSPAGGNPHTAQILVRGQNVGLVQFLTDTIRALPP